MCARETSEHKIQNFIILFSSLLFSSLLFSSSLPFSSHKPTQVNMEDFGLTPTTFHNAKPNTAFSPPASAFPSWDLTCETSHDFTPQNHTSSATSYTPPTTTTATATATAYTPPTTTATATSATAYTPPTYESGFDLSFFDTFGMRLISFSVFFFFFDLF
jgi:hypothetical protein